MARSTQKFGSLYLNAGEATTAFTRMDKLLSNEGLPVGFDARTGKLLLSKQYLENYYLSVYEYTELTKMHSEIEMSESAEVETLLNGQTDIKVFGIKFSGKDLIIDSKLSSYQDKLLAVLFYENREYFIYQMLGIRLTYTGETKNGIMLANVNGERKATTPDNVVAGYLGAGLLQMTVKADGSLYTGDVNITISRPGDSLTPTFSYSSIEVNSGVLNPTGEGVMNGMIDSPVSLSTKTVTMTITEVGGSGRTATKSSLVVNENAITDLGDVDMV